MNGNSVSFQKRICLKVWFSLHFLSRLWRSDRRSSSNVRQASTNSDVEISFQKCHVSASYFLWLVGICNQSGLRVKGQGKYVRTSITLLYQYSETNVMHFSFSLLRIKGPCMFRDLLAHPKEAMHKRHLVHCVRAPGLQLPLQSWCSQLT
jgi:hypothetical protein